MMRKERMRMSFNYADYAKFFKQGFEDEVQWNSEHALMANWISVNDEMPRPYHDVLVTCVDGEYGFKYINCAFFVETHTVKWSRDYDLCAADYYEDENAYYLKQGWYENVDTWDGKLSVVSDTVTHWLPLPIPAGVEPWKAVLSVFGNARIRNGGKGFIPGGTDVRIRNG